MSCFKKAILPKKNLNLKRFLGNFLILVTHKSIFEK